MLCADATDPRSSGSAVPPLCFWGAGSACRPCPPGGVCPGGFNLWSAPGFYVADAAASVDPLPCDFPAAARCQGFNASAGSTICGASYLQGSYACRQCAPGFYTQSSGACTPCPVGASVASSLSALANVALSAAVVVGTGGVVGAVGTVLTVRAGGALRPALVRSVKFILTAFSALQLAATMTRAAPAGGVAPFVDAVFAGLRGLQFEGLTPTPFACIGLPPLAIPVGILASALVLTAAWAAAALAWSLRVAAGPKGKVGGGDASGAAAHSCGDALSRRLTGGGTAAASLALTAVGLLYAIIANAAFGVLVCRAATVTLPQYLLLAQDGSAASAALGVPVAALYSVRNASLLAAPFAVPLAAADTNVVCGEGSQPAAARLAWAVVVLVLAAMPLGTITFLRAAAQPAVLRATPVPAALWPTTPHVTFGGASVDDVLAHKGLASAAARKASAGELSPRVTEWELYNQRHGEAAARRKRYVGEGGAPATEQLRRVAADAFGLGSRFEGGAKLSSSVPLQPMLAEALALQRSQAPATPALDGEGGSAGKPPPAANEAPSLLRFEAPLVLLPASEGAAAAAPPPSPARDAVLEADTVITLCGCALACTRRYRRGVQTGGDVLDSSLGLRDEAAGLGLFAPLLASDFRTSQAHFVQLNWALLGAIAAANTAVPATAPPSTVLARGAVIAVACAAMLAALLAARPMRPTSAWLLPLRAYILVLTAAGAVFVALAAASPASPATQALGYVVAILAVCLFPICAALFLAYSHSGLLVERRLTAIAEAARAAAAAASATTRNPALAAAGVAVRIQASALLKEPESSAGSVDAAMRALNSISKREVGKGGAASADAIQRALSTSSQREIGKEDASGPAFYNPMRPRNMRR